MTEQDWRAMLQHVEVVNQAISAGVANTSDDTLRSRLIEASRSLEELRILCEVGLRLSPRSHV